MGINVKRKTNAPLMLACAMVLAGGYLKINEKTISPESPQFGTFGVLFRMISMKKHIE